MPNMTVLVPYLFDLSVPAQRDEWIALESRLNESHPPRMHSYSSNGSHSTTGEKLKGLIDLDTTHLFTNQWNSVSGHRVFDWALDAKPPQLSHIKAGYYLEQMDWMKLLRRKVHACGYCGAQTETVTNWFCRKCLGSEYLKHADLRLLRLLPIAENHVTRSRPPLTEEETREITPEYERAQGLGAAEREAKAMTTKRRKIAALVPEAEAKANELIECARIETIGKTWLMDNGWSEIDNTIYYKHTKRWGFGWFKPLDGDDLSKLLDIIAEFPYDYSIKCADGRTLSN